jgi:hypothetical protein
MREAVAAVRHDAQSRNAETSSSAGRRRAAARRRAPGGSARDAHQLEIERAVVVQM